MNLNFILIAALILAYFIGSLNFAVLTSKIFRLTDPKIHGSKNAGATNVLRLSGKKFGVIVLLGDVLKAVIPLIICKYAFDFATSELIYVGFAIFLGHLFPIYFGFKGGKGVATGFGVILVIAPLVALSIMIVFILTLLLTRFVSLASIFAAFCMPFCSYFVIYDNLNIFSFITLSIFSLLLIAMHHQNIVKLFNGSESRAW